MKKDRKIQTKASDKITTYFVLEKWTLLIVTLSGILYNIGMTAGPWFEGQLVQCLLDILSGKKVFRNMAVLVAVYIGVIFLVQLSRFIKRLYVRKFANHVNRNMKQILYRQIVRKSKLELAQEGTGSMMTKAISDVDTCVEGMRKFTTEIFDTGVVMAAYIVMLLVYDWRLTILAMVFPPVAYFIAEKLKGVVSKSAAACKKSAGQLNGATMDRVSNAMTYRVYGREKQMDHDYEEALTDYEKKAARANLWETSMQPIYQIISSLSVIFILWFGAENVLGQGWTTWNIASFTTFLSCFTKLAVKSSKAAKLFNAVQKAKVSWKRVKPYLREEKEDRQNAKILEGSLLLHVENLSFQYTDGGNEVLKNLNFDLKEGEILGVTGPVACGKSTLGKVFLCEEPYEGHIQLNGQELAELFCCQTEMGTAYMGHQPELLSTTIEENILLGREGNVLPYLQAVCMEGEIREMPKGIHTVIGNGGVRLSGGQQARIALARTLFHRKKIVVLDDPFSAVDKDTEQRILQNIRPYLEKSVVLLISHRLSVFPKLDQILWMEAGTAGIVETHENLIKDNPAYGQMYDLQIGGKDQ